MPISHRVLNNPPADGSHRALLDLVGAVFPAPCTVLEIGSGLGQHAVWLARELPWLVWQPSDRPRFLPLLRKRIASASVANLRPPVVLDVAAPWPVLAVGGVYSANTAHVMPWPVVEAMFEGVARLVPVGGRFCLVGPYRRAGRFASASDRRFDAMLRARNPLTGLRDVEALFELAERVGLALADEVDLPGRDQALVWERRSVRV